MLESGYSFNENFLLYELYEISVASKNVSDEVEKHDFINSEDIEFIITNEDYPFLKAEYIILEYFYLLITKNFDFSNLLLKQTLAKQLRFDLSELLIDDQTQILRSVMQNEKITKKCIKLALERQIEGVAYEIIQFTEVNLDEELLETAIKNNCAIFLENIWESSMRFEGLSSIHSAKFNFSLYIEKMIIHQKYEMAREAIKYWSETYKQENVFEVLMENENEELMMELFQTAASYNYKIDIVEEQFKIIVNRYYFLMKYLAN